jgi:CRISPR system Cascade subunit CasA
LPFSLLSDTWIPVRRASGRSQTIRPCDLTDDIAGDPIVSLDWPRPDFRLAGLEFLIGLLATACPPDNDDDSNEPGGWLVWWDAPPTPDQLAKAFAPLESAFVLDGDGPRFMQDFEAFGGEPNPIETLLIDAPGGQTRKKNADHFVKRDAANAMGRAAAAMALFTLQTFAPAGGAGNRVGLRGGGPLTTLAMPPRTGGLPLWHWLWTNVPIGEAATPVTMKQIFPWLAPTRTSEGKIICTPNDAHVLQAFWGMPRRIRLVFEDNATAAPCDLTGSADVVLVRGWCQRPYGVNYANWLHPLSPYYRQKPTDAEWLPVHAQPGGVGYRHWVGLLFDDARDSPKRLAAASIQRFRDPRLRRVTAYADRQNWRLLAAGYDMDNMKARGFVESEMPIIEPGDPRHTPEFIDMLRQLIAAATEAASLLGRSVRRALFSDGAKVGLDAGFLNTIRARFWDVTETPFLDRVRDAATPDFDQEAVRRAWLGSLARTAKDLFAEAAPMDASGADRRPDRIAAAAKGLSLALSGYGKDGDALFRALGLPAPETAAAKKSKAKPGKQAA